MKLEFSSTIKSSKGFYIGDICYVLADKVYYDLWAATNFADGPHHEPETGADFAVGSTEYGDGEYYDQFGHAYPVDAGVIGCVPDELLNKDEIIKSYGYRNENAGLYDVINEFGLFVEGDTAEFYSTGKGEFNIKIRKDGKTVKSIHIDTRSSAEYDDEEESY